MKKSKLALVIINGMCAVIWTVKAVLGIGSQIYDDSVLLSAADVSCAVMWIIVFIMNLIEYRSGSRKG